LLALQGIPVPRTLFALRSEHMLRIAQTLQVPLVVKAAAASRGRNNHLVTDHSQLSELLQTELNPYIVQPCLANDHDLRIICFGGEPALVLKRARQSNETHLNNTSTGGTGTWVSLQKVSPHLLTACRNICKIMGREMAGIDFIPDAASPFSYACLEVNAIPQLTSGTDVAKKMDALITTLKHARKQL